MRDYSTGHMLKTKISKNSYTNIKIKKSDIIINDLQ